MPTDQEQNMESNILNMYHQARYRTIDHNVIRSMSESLSSEGSCNQNSPEYIQGQASSQYEEESNEGEYWDAQDRNLWSQNQKINITKSHDSSIDEEVDVQEISIDEKNQDSSDHEDDPDIMEDNSLVEGADYDVIQVFAVDPDLDLEVSSEEDDEVHSDDEENEDEEEYLSPQDKPNYTETDNVYTYQQNSKDSICTDNLGINLDTPVVSNVDEYFIKDKDILAVKDGPIVNDVDEYFIKNVKVHTQPSVEEDFLIPAKLPHKPDFTIEKGVPNVEEFFATVDVNDVKVMAVEEMPEQEIEAEVPLNESDLEVLPNIEDLKQYLLEDTPYSKLKSAQRSCSVPHSPMRNICLDLDAKTCLSFEDLNLDLSDLSFENSKDKSNNSSKSDDIPRTLTEEDVNSFLITPVNVTKPKQNDDLSPLDMEIDKPVDSVISTIEQTNSVILPHDIPIQALKNSLEEIPAIKPVTHNEPKIKKEQASNFMPSYFTDDCQIKTTSTPIKRKPQATKVTSQVKPTVLDFCIEKNNIVQEVDTKITELEDFVDVESCNDSIMPVLEANNLNSLLEQFEATEKLNTNPKKPVVKLDLKGKNLTTLTNGTRLQDAGVQLNKNKMRQILMPSTINTEVRRSPSPVHSDHDYCSTKKRHSLPNIKGGRSLLKPEVLSSNHKILSSRHRSCKDKKIVYHQSSDEEGEKFKDIKKKLLPNRSSDDSDIKKRPSSKQTLKTSPNSSYRKKVSPVRFVSDDIIDKSNDSVMVKNASKASDTASSQNSSIKLTIKNKSEVIIKKCDSKDNHKVKIIEKDKSNSQPAVGIEVCKNLSEMSKQIIDKDQMVIEGTQELSDKDKAEESKAEDFYVTLFPNKKDVQIPQAVLKNSEKRSHSDDSKVSPEPLNRVETEQPQKRKKLNLQEYKLRRGASSNTSSAQVSPESIFPEMPTTINLEKDVKVVVNQEQTIEELTTNTSESKDSSKKIFDPIREASRKILMNSKKMKAEAIRKRDEDFVMSKIPKVENLELKPLISDAEMMKIVGMSADPILPIPIATEIIQQSSKDYDEIIMVSIGTNTDENMFKRTEVMPAVKKPQSPPKESKSIINFKIKKSENVLKHNVFDSTKNGRSPTEDKKFDINIDEERYKGITATLKSVEKQVETRISSNSLFASIQDVVMKKATKPHADNSSPEYKYAKPTIIRDYDDKDDHGEDKVILHLEKNRRKPELAVTIIQTDCTDDYKPLQAEVTECPPIELSISPRKRNDSDMSMSSDTSPVRKPHSEDIKSAEVKERQKESNEKQKEMKEKQKEEALKRSRSKERHAYRRSRSHSRGHRRNRSRSRTRSRSRGRFKRYRRSDSPYRRKRRSYSRRSPTPRRDYRRSRSRSRYAERAKSPVRKSQPKGDKKFTKSLSPPVRKATVSESSDTSTSSSSSSESSSSASSRNSRSSSVFRKNEQRDQTFRKSYSSEDRESNTPVEERRIVFVGKLEQDITKASLRSQFTKFGPVTEVRLHSKEDGTRYGFVTYQRPRDAWSAVEAAATFPQYDVGFGGRRAFCRQSYADLDGLEATYTESAFHGQGAAPVRRNDDMSFEQMLLDIKKKLNKRKGDKRPDDSA
ncbi:unnamed protein product [Leptosia nina]|uniref:RRM domain-containing protein n=1 Tax=Leptosia nina TaxID=320188 RepID=A0AAV1IUX7_9NEOP